MNHTHTTHRARRRRVRQAPLPTEQINRPRGGDWSRMERAAARAMASAHKAAGL